MSALGYLIIGILMGVTVIGEVAVMYYKHKKKKVPGIFRFIANNSTFSFMKEKDSGKDKKLGDK